MVFHNFFAKVDPERLCKYAMQKKCYTPSFGVTVLKTWIKYKTSSPHVFCKFSDFDFSRQEIDYSTISNRKHFEAHGEPEVRIESNNVILEIPRYDDNKTKNKQEKAKENAEENSPKRQLSGMGLIIAFQTNKKILKKKKIKKIKSWMIFVSNFDNGLLEGLTKILKFFS